MLRCWGGGVLGWWGARLLATGLLANLLANLLDLLIARLLAGWLVGCRGADLLTCLPTGVLATSY